MSLPAQTVRFGPFLLDLRAAELRSNGNRTKLPEQPFQVLAALLEKPGEVVTRDELRQRLWGAETFVDFEHGLNAAVKRLRESLGDSAEHPRYIETLPRHGYRLMIPVEKPEAPAPAPPTDRPRRWRVGIALGFVLVVALAAGVTWRLRQRASAAPIRIDSLAVLPLENLSGNPDEEFFADGMTEALITELGKVHALRVISRQSVMHHKGTDKTVPQIAKELNVDAVVEGSALRAGGKVRITTQLIQANPERHLWSESYERNASDVIALQREIVQAIAREVRVSLTGPEQQRLAQVRPVSPEAYEAYLKGHYFLNKTPEGLKRSVDFFNEAIAKDPGYAPSYVGLAESYIALGDRYQLRPEEAYPKALPLVLKALALDDTLSEAHNALAGILDLNWDWAGAEREYLRALELDAGNARAHHWYGIFLLGIGRTEEAVAENRRALQLNPGSRVMNAGLAVKLIYAGRYDEAVEQGKVSVEMDESSAPGHFALGFAYTKKGMREQAISELKRAVALTPGYSGFMSALAYSYGVFGETTEACRVTEEMKRLSTRRYVAPTDLALGYTACGRSEEAIRWLETAYRVHDVFLGALQVDPMLEKLRPDPRFQDLVRRMNFPH